MVRSCIHWANTAQTAHVTAKYKTAHYKGVNIYLIEIVTLPLYFRIKHELTYTNRWITILMFLLFIVVSDRTQIAASNIWGDLLGRITDLVGSVSFFSLLQSCCDAVIVQCWVHCWYHHYKCDLTTAPSNTPASIWFWPSLIHPELKLQNILFWLRAWAPKCSFLVGVKLEL